VEEISLGAVASEEQAEEAHSEVSNDHEEFEEDISEEDFPEDDILDEIYSREDDLDLSEERLWQLEKYNEQFIKEGKGSFPKFMLLPPEIRAMIWECALPPPRTVRICLEADPRYRPHGVIAPEILNDRYFPMPLADVCAESRDFIKRFGYARLWADQHYMTDTAIFVGPWFCNGRDKIWDMPADLILACLGLSPPHTGEWIVNTS
jgi:hypothetical protein